jgi:hypothetical protein
MRQMWIWFGIVYGNLNALVMSVVAGALFVDTRPGGRFCSSIFVDTGTCRVWILLILGGVFGTSTLLSVRKLMALRRRERDFSAKDPESKGTRS